MVGSGPTVSIHSSRQRQLQSGLTTPKSLSLESAIDDSPTIPPTYPAAYHQNLSNMDPALRQRQEAQLHLSIARTSIQRHPRSSPITQPSFARSSNSSGHQRRLEPAESSKKVLQRILELDVGGGENREVEKAEREGKVEMGEDGSGGSGERYEWAARKLEMDEDYDGEVEEGDDGLF